MSITQTVASKLFVGFVALAMALTLVAPAQAQTEAELQAQIDQLMATINALQSQLGQSSGDSMMSGGSSASVCPYAWTRTLSQGSTGADVMALQQFLNSDPMTQVAASGVGSAGMETDYFGGLTGSAVEKFQVKHRDAILTPVGLVNPVPNFGPSTMAHANALCSSAPSMGDGDGDGDGHMDDDDHDDGDLEGGEADVDSYDFSDEEDEIEEGEEDVPVLNIEFDVEDGDVRLERMDIVLENVLDDNDDEDDPWDAFDELSVWVDGDKVASEDVTDEDDWDELTATDQYEFRVTNIDSVFREDDTGEVIVALSAAGGVDVDGDANADAWDIFVQDEGMRFVDSEGLDIEGPNGAGDQSRFDIVEAGDGDDLDLESSSEDPDSATLEIDEDDEIEHAIFAFDLSAEDSDGDVVLDNLVSVNIFVGGTDGSDVDNFVDDFRLEIDGDSYDAESWDDMGNPWVTVDFDVDGDTSISEDEEVTAMLYAIFDDVDNTFSDATIQASTSPSQIDAEGENSGEEIDPVGGSTRTGDQHTVRLDGVDLGDVTDGDGSSDSTQPNDPTDVDDSYGTMFLTFDITPFGDDAYIPTASSTRSGTAALSGITYTIENSDTGVAEAAGTSSVTYDVDGADENNGFFELEEGQSYEMTVTVNSYNPAAEGTFNFQLISVGFAADDTAGVTSTEAPGEVNDYESDGVFIPS